MVTRLSAPHNAFAPRSLRWRLMCLVLARRALLWGLLVVIAGVAPGCRSQWAARAIERARPVRAASLEPWRSRTIANGPAIQWAQKRHVFIADGADGLVVTHAADGNATLAATLQGALSTGGGGSAVALTSDGYLLTAEHCIFPAPLIAVMYDHDPTRATWAPARVVWSPAHNSDDPSSEQADIALLHAPLENLTPIEWAPLALCPEGTPVLSVGVGTDTTRCAAGFVSRAPSEIADIPEALPRRALMFTTNAPLMPGDSGGPTFVEIPDPHTPGQTTLALLGVAVTADLIPDSTTFRSGIARPNPAWLNELIERDRAARHRASIPRSHDPSIP